MNLDEIKQDWQKKQAPEITEQEQSDNLFQQYIKLNKSMVRTNLFMSISMVLTMLFIAWVWWTYQAKQGWAFDGSILCIEVLIFIMTVIAWTRVADEHQLKVDNNTISFLKAAILKLKRSIWITKKVIPVYAVLLNLSLILYFYDLMISKPSWFIWASVGTTLYIVIASILGYRRHRKKQKREVEPLIADMQAVLDRIN